MNKFFQVTLLALVLLAVAGCPSDDQRLAEQANEASQRQAAQNVEMARVNREVAEGSKRLVETVAQTSHDTTTLQRELQTERRDLATQHRHESLLAAVLTNVGSVLVCLLPLVLCLYLFRTLSAERTDEGMVDLLIDEATVERPLWLDSPSDGPRIGQEKPQGLLPDETGQSPDSSQAAAAPS